jgi:hypothetical protein
MFLWCIFFKPPFSARAVFSSHLSFFFFFGVLLIKIKIEKLKNLLSLKKKKKMGIITSLLSFCCDLHLISLANLDTMWFGPLSNF